MAANTTVKTNQQNSIQSFKKYSNASFEYQKTYNLEQCQKTNSCIVKVDIGVLPHTIDNVTISLTGNNVCLKHLFTCCISAFKKTTLEKLYTHDAEDQPENHTDEEDVDNSWNGVHQSVHHYLYVHFRGNMSYIQNYKHTFLHLNKLLLVSLNRFTTLC